MRRRPANHRSAASCALALLCCATVAAVAAGCDSRRLLAPATRTVAPPARDASAAAIIGAASVSSEQTGGVPAAPVSESTWVVVQVSGQYNASPNPACGNAPPNWPCIFNPPASSFYAPAPFTSGPVQAWVASGGTSAIPLRGTGGAANTAGQAIGLFFAPTAGELMVRSAVANYITTNPNPGAQLSSWIMSGNYIATVTSIPNPLTFSGGPTGNPDGTVSFTVGTTAPLLFINPNGVPAFVPPGDVDWYIVPGDAVPLTYERTNQAYEIFSCYRKYTCTYTPPPNLNGRMQVVAYVEGQLVIGRSDYLRSGCQNVGGAVVCSGDSNPDVRVTCAGATGGDPVRGAQVICKTSVSPAMPLAVTSRSAQARNLVVSDTVRHEHGAGETDEWAGTAVAETRVTVQVEVSVGGQKRMLRGTGRFGIIPRPWSVYRITTPTVVHAVFPDQMGLIPGQPNYGVFRLDSIQIGAADVTTVDSGPNAGAVLFTSQPQFAGRGAIIHLHPALYPPFPNVYPGFPPGFVATIWTMWYNDQNGNAGPGWHQPYPSCSQTDLVTLRSELERHEGVTLAFNSHAGLANRIFQSSKLHERFEGFYQTSVTDSAFRVAAWGVYSRWWSTEFWPPQRNFDAGPTNDTNLTWAAIGCSTDNDLKSP